MYVEKISGLWQSINENQIFILYLLTTLLGYLLYAFSSRFLLEFISNLIKETSTKFDDILLEKKVFKNLPYLIPLIFFYSIRDFLPLLKTLDRVITGLIILVLLITSNALINAFNDVYSKSRYSEKLNIKSYMQILKLLVNIFGIIILAASLTGRSPIYFISGFGALTAVLLIVFKDTILALVSSIQISSNNLFRIGDWLEIPQFNADGSVIDIALHSIKIQNWDNTISVIPTSKLIDSSFKNWRGMSESGGRRIKRSIKIDIDSIKFCDESMIQKFKNIKVLEDYINAKLIDIDKHNLDSEISLKDNINGRSLTNIGTFRAYIEYYLKNSPDIHQNMTFLIRQLAPDTDGMPIEIYVFTKSTDWNIYESIQSDIFDHLLAILPEFELRAFQNLTDINGKK